MLRSLFADEAHRKLTSVWNQRTHVRVVAAVVALAWGCGDRPSETGGPPHGSDGGAPDAVPHDDASSDSAACRPDGAFPDGGAPAQATSFFGFHGQMVLDGHDVVLTAGGVSPGSIYGALIRTTPGGAGGVTVLASGTQDAWIGAALAADPRHFYFATHGGPGAVFALDRAGGAPVKLADTQGEVLGFAVDATRLYWAEGAVGSSSTGAIRAVSLSCGPPVVLAANQAVSGPIAVDASRIYWSIEVFSQDAGEHFQSGAILAMPLAGGAPTILATDPYIPNSMVVDGTSLFWAAAASGGIDCPVGFGGRIVGLASSGGQPVVLASNLDGPGSLGLSGDAVYFSEWGPVPCNNGDPTGLGTVAKVPRAGGPVVPLASHVTVPGPVVIDGANLDFAELTSVGGAGAVVAVGN